MLLTEYVDVKPIGNINYYRELGYLIPTKFSKKKNKNVIDTTKTISVKVSDLPKKAKHMIEYKCDDCGEIFSIHYFAYLSSLHDDKKYCQRCCAKGERSACWDSTIPPENRIARRVNIENDIFRRKVLKRDNYICQVCGNTKQLCVHHLDGYNWNSEKRYSETNGITLCETCHNEFHNIYGVGIILELNFWNGQKKLLVRKNIILLHQPKK